VQLICVATQPSFPVNASTLKLLTHFVTHGRHYVHCSCSSCEHLPHLCGCCPRRNLHTELAFNLGHSTHFQTSIDFLMAKPGTDDKIKHSVVVACLHADEQKVASLESLITPLSSHLTPLSQLRQHCNVAALTKVSFASARTASELTSGRWKMADGRWQVYCGEEWGIAHCSHTKANNNKKPHHLAHGHFLSVHSMLLQLYLYFLPPIAIRLIELL